MYIIIYFSILHGLLKKMCHDSEIILKYERKRKKRRLYFKGTHSQQKIGIIFVISFNEQFSYLK